MNAPATMHIGPLGSTIHVLRADAGTIAQLAAIDWSRRFRRVCLDPARRHCRSRLPLKAGPSARREAGTWFDGLLPEREQRERLARQAPAASMSTYSMPRAIGAECAGAVEVRVPGERRHAGKEPASTGEIEEYIRQMDRFPLRPGERRLTLSLAGAQAKFVLVGEKVR